VAILSVTQLNRYVGFKLKEDRALQSVLVRGEITNFTNHYRSGHLYFTLRDAESCVKAVMFRSHAQRLKFLPQEGMNVIAAASAALYERDGAFQIYVTDLQPDGTGGKALALEQLKKKLTAMGVFDAASKRPLPAMPKKIGVITSDTGAALQDVKNVIGRTPAGLSGTGAGRCGGGFCLPCHCGGGTGQLRCPHRRTGRRCFGNAGGVQYGAGGHGDLQLYRAGGFCRGA